MKKAGCMSEIIQTASKEFKGSTRTSAVVKAPALPSAKRKGWTIVAIVVATATVLAGLGAVLSGPRTDTAAGGPLAEVTRGAMLISITESGDLEAISSMKVAN